jgi:hypothetical protein
MATMTRIEESDLEILRQLAKSHRRSMTQELGHIINGTAKMLTPEWQEETVKGIRSPEIEYDKPAKEALSNDLGSGEVKDPMPGQKGQTQ